MHHALLMPLPSIDSTSYAAPFFNLLDDITTFVTVHSLLRAASSLDRTLSIGRSCIDDLLLRFIICFGPRARVLDARQAPFCYMSYVGCLQCMVMITAYCLSYFSVRHDLFLSLINQLN